MELTVNERHWLPRRSTFPWIRVRAPCCPTTSWTHLMTWTSTWMTSRLPMRQTLWSSWETATSWSGKVSSRLAPDTCPAPCQTQRSYWLPQPACWNHPSIFTGSGGAGVLTQGSQNSPGRVHLLLQVHAHFSCKLVNFSGGTWLPSDSRR